MTTLPSPVAIAGAGTMGAGFAAVLAAHGADVRLCARRESSLAAADARIRGTAETLGSDPEAVAGRVTATTDPAEACRDAAFVIETIAEQLEPKLELLALAESVAAPDAILVSNTSSLPLAPLAAALARPERFAGFHWFNPPELVDLVEVVGGPATEPAVLEQLVAWARALGKAPVVVRRDVPGFIGNRLQYALLREAWALVEAGVCSYEDVDLALTHGLGARWAAIGPFQTVDLAGLEIHLAVARNLYPELSTATSPSAVLEEAVAEGTLGCKSGRGLLGEYPADAIAALTARRDRMLQAISRERRAAT
jgi:3-hydroxybutyryl-CoA dehydrogenase